MLVSFAWFALVLWFVFVVVYCFVLFYLIYFRFVGCLVGLERVFFIHNSGMRMFGTESGPAEGEGQGGFQPPPPSFLEILTSY